MALAIWKPHCHPATAGPAVELPISLEAVSREFFVLLLLALDFHSICHGV